MFDGQSGLFVSPVCLGGNPGGRRDGGPGRLRRGREPSLLRPALDSGINYFDTADTYNAGDSERIMGATLLKMAKRETSSSPARSAIPLSDKPNDAALAASTSWRRSMAA
jgi:aryl-alcohol dehydrogenase (NADP+)